MSLIENGTRLSATQAQTVGSSTRTVSQGYTRDVGLATIVTGAVVFASNGTLTLAGAFGAFQPGMDVLVEGTNLNNGKFYVTAASANALTVTPAPKPETPAAATVRSA